MASDSDRLFRRLWLVNGFMFLIALIAALGLIAYAFAGNAFGGRNTEVRAEPVTGEPGELPAARAVRYSAPETIVGSDVTLIQVRNGRGDVAGIVSELGSSDSYSRNSDGPSVNVIFLEPGATSGRLLLDRPAYIGTVDYPTSKSDSLQHYIAYSIVFDDTNHDGTLDDEDLSAVYVTDLQGRGLKRVSPEGLIVRSRTLLSDGRLLILGISQPPKGEKDERMPQRAFVYDFGKGTTNPVSALDSLAMRAGSLLGRR